MTQLEPAAPEPVPEDDGGSAKALQRSLQLRTPVDWILYVLASALLAILRALPLSLVARMGRSLGYLVYLVDRRHRRVAIDNLRQAFSGEKTEKEIQALARENILRISENIVCAIWTAGLDDEQVKSYIEVSGCENVGKGAPTPPQGFICAIGHFGNFELYARLGNYFPAYQLSTTYRALDQPAMNRILQKLRANSGCLYFERRWQNRELRAALGRGSLCLGLLVDQHAGSRALWIPFFGRICSTNTAPATLALRYRWPIHITTCFWIRRGRWRIEFSEEIPTQVDGRPRSVEEISLDINRALEAAVRKDPANWFWVHRRWKPFRPRSRRRHWS